MINVKILWLLLAMLFFSMLFTSSSDAMEQKRSGQWVQDWWDNTYELRIKEGQSIGTCESRLSRYRQKVQENPDSRYYRETLEKWERKCNGQ